MDLKEFFLNVSEESIDQKWKQIFVGIANNIFPSIYFSIRDGKIIFRYANKYIEQDIPGDPKEAYFVLRNFITLHAGILSSDNLPKITIKEQSWARIRNNMSTLGTYINGYVNMVGSHYSLTPNEKDRLSLFLITSIRSGEIQDVVIDHYRILSIQHLVFDTVNRVFLLTKKGHLSAKKSSPSTKKSGSKWNNTVSCITGHYADIATFLHKVSK
jgi:hypothetical protein